MSEFRVVPDVLRYRDETKRGRQPTSPLAKALLNGQTVFIPGPRKTYGNLYSLAKNHNMKARTRLLTINNEQGVLIWFEEAALV